MDSRGVEEAMIYMVRLGLFTEVQGVVACHKILHYLGDNITRNPDLKVLIKEAKTARLSQTVSDSMRLSQREERRGEEKREEKNKNKRFAPPSIQEVSDYCADRGNSVDPQTFLDHYEANGWVRGKTKIKCWKACVRTWEKNSPSAQQVSYL
jgi:hypothetical protein